MNAPRTGRIRDINSILRKHKRNKERRLRLGAAQARAAIPARTGRDELGDETS